MTPDGSPPDDQSAAIAQAIQDVSDKAQLLVREEIELAKTEIETKVKSLVKGAAVGIAGGLFAVVGLMFLLVGFAYLIWYEIPFPDQTYFWGFFIMAVILFGLGGLAAFLALKAFKKGAPPTPKLAIQEAQRIKTTVQSSDPENTL